MATGHEPDGSCSSFALWDHGYTDEELKALVVEQAEPAKPTRRQDGRYRPVGSGAATFGIGQRATTHFVD